LRKIRIKSTTATTTPGFANSNGQIVVRDTGFASETFPGQRVYHMRCAHCGFEYGANGTDVAKRLCPGHQGGARGERLRAAGPGLFDELEEAAPRLIH
jgi:hypothetical protein